MADLFFIDAENLVPQAVESNFEEEKNYCQMELCGSGNLGKY